MSAAWSDDFFDDLYARWCMTPLPPAYFVAAADFIELALELTQPSRIFDQCSGIGQLALMLAGRGHVVTGVERNPSYVAAARDAATRERRGATFFAGDAGSFITPEPCDAALNWHTSFGYGGDAGEDARWLDCVHASLKTGGSFLLEVGNRARVVSHFTPQLVSTLRRDDGEALLTRNCVFEHATGIMRQTWRFTLPDGVVHERASVVRIYGRDELADMLASHGFSPQRWFGGVDARPLTHDSERCIVVARKQ